MAVLAPPWRGGCAAVSSPGWSHTWAVSPSVAGKATIQNSVLFFSPLNPKEHLCLFPERHLLRRVVACKLLSQSICAAENEPAASLPRCSPCPVIWAQTPASVSLVVPSLQKTHPKNIMEKQKLSANHFRKVSKGCSWPGCFLQCLHWQSSPKRERSREPPLFLPYYKGFNPIPYPHGPS